MEIISISLDDGKAQQIQVMMEKSGIKSRSKFFRGAINEMLQKQKLLSQLKGNGTVVFMITHGHLHKADATSKIIGYENIVKTVIHHHSNRGCLDILIAEGDAEHLRGLYRKIQELKGTQGVSCSII